MKYLFNIVVLLVICCTWKVQSEDYDFATELESYSSLAKEFSKKNITPDDSNRLFTSVQSILCSIKKKYLIKKMKADSFVLLCKDHSKFPDFTMIDNLNKYEEPFVKFTIAIHTIIQNLTDDIIIKIVEKSPLEFVSLLQEICVFWQFISANPSEFGHGFFSMIKNRQLTVFVTIDSIFRIMRYIMLVNLLLPNFVYKLSRTTSEFYRKCTDKNPQKIFQNAVESMKRSPADDSRITIFFDRDF
jgi:hypothetical protein